MYARTAQVPVIVVGCKLDLRADGAAMPAEIWRPILELHEAEACFECSARTFEQARRGAAALSLLPLRLQT